MDIDLDELTRVTVVHSILGRVLEFWHQEVEVQVQDEGRTLKVFLHDMEQADRSVS